MSSEGCCSGNRSSSTLPSAAEMGCPMVAAVAAAAAASTAQASSSSVGGSTNGSSSPYFSSYSDPRVHALMLRDRPRVAAYAAAVSSLSPLIKGKVVLDVGAGSGILSFLAAAAGAAAVLAVEGSSETAALLQQQLQHNEREGRVPAGVVSVFSCPVEELSVHPNFKQEYIKGVDIIISEWMGFYLLHEGMLQSVLYARDHFLNPVSGLLLPCSARLLLCLCCSSEVYAQQLGFLTDYCGFSFRPLQQQLLHHHSTTPLVLQLGPECCCCTPAAVVAEIDLYTVTPGELERIKSQATLRVHQTATVHGFAFWFDVAFPGLRGSATSAVAEAHAAAAAAGYRGSPPRNPSAVAAARFAAAEAAAALATPETSSSSCCNRIEQAAAAAAAAATAAATAAGTAAPVAVPHRSKEEVVLDTSPFSAPTHWQQFLLLLPEPLVAPEGMELTIEAALQQDNNNPRFYQVSVDVVDAILPLEQAHDNHQQQQQSLHE